MRLASYSLDGRASYGIASAEDLIIDIPAAAGRGAPASLLDFLEVGEAGMQMAQAATAAGR